MHACLSYLRERESFVSAIAGAVPERVVRQEPVGDTVSLSPTGVASNSDGAHHVSNVPRSAQRYRGALSM
jgi:hypothetical protein